MAGQITIRKLVSVLTINATAAVKGLKAYSVLWDATAKGVEVAATRIEKAAARAGAAMAGVAAGAAGMQSGASGGGSRGGAGGSPRGRAGGGQSSPVVDDIVARGARSNAAQAGMVAGAKAVNDATAALGKFSTASERARAKVADLTSQVARNRTEMAALRAKVVETGDADGTLAARMRGLAAETGIASQRLAAARRELRAIDGGLIDAVKSAGSFRGALTAASVAAGNLASGLVQRLASGAVGVLGESAKAAMDFEKALVDVQKVARGADLTEGGLLDPRVKQGIKDVSRELGVMPDQVAQLTAQLTGAFSGKTDIVKLSEDVGKVAVAWDISGKFAGEYFKQTSAGLQLNADDTKALFGTINELGNQFGIQSSEIAEAMTRSAGVLKGANISGETGAALNATLIKAGASAEVAATGVRTFIARLGAGEAATDKQIKAFQALGLNAEAVAKNLSSGDAARAERQIQDVVAALVKMGETAPDKRMATLIELFGSESIGSIGAAASATEALAGAFQIAGDKGAALTSIQKEYDNVSNTTAARVDKLKANIGVLAIEFGEALLPHIDRVVNFLTSPEGKEWGANAVARATEFVSGLASVVGTVVSAFMGLTDVLGGTATAIAGLGLAALALGGPFAAAAAAGVAAAAVITTSFLKAIGVMEKAGNTGRDQQIKDLESKYAAQDKADEDEATAQGMTGRGIPGMPGVDIPDRVGPMGPITPGEADRLAGPGAVGATDPRERFDELAAKVRAGKGLRQSEKKELRSLTKALDEVSPKKAGRGHKATKMDKQLAAMDPSLRGLLRQGGDADAGGDLKVADNILDRGVFASATKGRGAGLGVGGVGSVGPGPNITTNDNRQYNTTIIQTIDASSSNPAAENIRRAGTEAAGLAGDAVRFTGAARVLAMRNGGGRLVPT